MAVGKGMELQLCLVTTVGRLSSKPYAVRDAIRVGINGYSNVG